MRRKHVLAGVVILLGLFFARELWMGMHSSLRIFGEENLFIVQTSSGDTIFFGDKETSRKDILLRAIQPYFSRKEPFIIADQEIGTSLEGSDFIITRISENIARGLFGTTTIWFWGTPEKEELTQLKSTPITLKSDFWVLKKNDFPDFLSLPRQAILHINERKPSKKLENFARENNLPLVSVKETGGFMMDFKNPGWTLWMR